MKILATLAMVSHGGAHKFMAISPRDDVWFVHDEDAPEELRKEAEEFCKGTPNGVVGYILVGVNKK